MPEIKLSDWHGSTPYSAPVSDSASGLAPKSPDARLAYQYQLAIDAAETLRRHINSILTLAGGDALPSQAALMLRGLYYDIGAARGIFITRRNALLPAAADETIKTKPQQFA